MVESNKKSRKSAHDITSRTEADIVENEVSSPTENIPGSGRRGGKVEKDWTKGSIVGNLLSLGWPMMLGAA